MEGEYNIHRWLPVLCSALGLPVMKEGTQVCHGRGDTAFPALLPRAYPVQVRPDLDGGGCIFFCLAPQCLVCLGRQAMEEGVQLLRPVTQWLGLSKEVSCGRRGCSFPFLASQGLPIPVEDMEEGERFPRPGFPCLVIPVEASLGRGGHRFSSLPTQDVTCLVEPRLGKKQVQLPWPGFLWPVWPMEVSHG